MHFWQSVLEEVAFFYGNLCWLWLILANSLRIVGELLRAPDSLGRAIDIGDLWGAARAIDNVAFVRGYADPYCGGLSCVRSCWSNLLVDNLFKSGKRNIIHGATLSEWFCFCEARGEEAQDASRKTRRCAGVTEDNSRNFRIIFDPLHRLYRQGGRIHHAVPPLWARDRWFQYHDFHRNTPGHLAKSCPHVLREFFVIRHEHLLFVRDDE